MSTNEIEDDFAQEVEVVVDEFLGMTASKVQKEELLNSLLIILHKRSREINDCLQDENNGNSMLNICDQPPYINIIIPRSQSNFISPQYYPQNYGCSQTPINQLAPQNPYFFNYWQAQPPIIPQQMQLFQVPGYPISINHTLNVKKKKSHHKSKHKSHKDSSSTKKKLKSTQKSQDENSGHIKSYKKGSSTIFELEKKGEELNGIFKYLTNKTGGNIHDNRTVEVTSNSINTASASNHPKSLLNDSQFEGYLSSCNKNEIWIIFDFKNMKVKITDYTIKIRNSPFSRITYWDIDVSNDRNNWKKIDHHVNDDSLSGCNITKTFTVQPNDFSRYVRFFTKKNNGTGGNYVISINSIEFYGSLEINNDH